MRPSPIVVNYLVFAGTDGFGLTIMTLTLCTPCAPLFFEYQKQVIFNYFQCEWFFVFTEDLVVILPLALPMVSKMTGFYSQKQVILNMTLFKGLVVILRIFNMQLVFREGGRNEKTGRSSDAV